MQRAVKLKQEALKMSVCSDFVEHIWKPGSCKNCFCPRNFHQLQTPPLDLGGSSGLLWDLNGIGAKAENTPLEDDGVISLPYSKPTIAVKPTMINSDAADMWVDGNLSTDIPQVSKRTASRKHILMKSGEEQRACIDNFSNNVIRKPAIQNTPNDCTSHGRPGISPSGLESRYISDRFVASALDSERYLPIHQRGGTSLSEKAGISSAPDLESEGGEYCSIVDYCGEAPVHLGFDSSKTKVEWPEKETPVSKFQGQDVAVNARAKYRVVNFSAGESRVLNADPDFQREKHPPRDYVYNHLCSETGILASLPDTVLKSSSPLGLSQGNYCCPQVRESEHTEGKHTEDVSNSVEQELSYQAGPQNEPIYAESTKRKKAQLGNSNTHARSDALACSPCRDQEDGLWREATLQLSCERELQDSATQVAATITIVAAHTEDDNRTIVLSSPDSAVGVQWPCVSPTSNPETGKTSPFFEHRELPQASSGMSSRENVPGLQTQIASKNVTGETPAIPPKLSKGSPPRGEGSLTRSVSSSTTETCDSPGHEDVDIPRNGTDCTVSEPSSSLCSHTNRISPEDSSRGLSSSCSERRQKYYNLPWSRQCRIEEEEEEEQGLLKSMPEMEMGNGASSPPRTSNFHQGGKCSVQVNKAGGMSKSASFAFEFPKDKNGIEDFAPPPPPPKKQSRHFLKMNKSSSELEKLNSDSTENLSPPFQGIVTFTAGSTDSLNLDTQTFNNGGQSCKMRLRSPTRTGKQIFPSAHFSACSSKDRPPSKPSQPPPLPQKKTVSRAVSSPDGFYWGPASPARAAAPSSPKLNFSQSESNVCIHEKSRFGTNLGINQRTFSSSESLEKAFKRSHFPFPCSGKNSSTCCSQNKNLPPRSFSQHSMSTQVSSGSSLQLHNLLSNIDNKEGVYTKLGGLYAESLRRLVSKCEDCFMRDQKSELHFSENNWSLFKLTCNKPCCDSGDAIYYCATCSKDPSSTYAVKICKSQDTKAAASCCSPSVPIHFNIQQDCGHFVASVPSSMLKNASTDGQCPPRAAAAAEQDCVVVITREVPQQTAADFVREAGPFHKAKPELYERRVCFLLLQLCNGLEHLKEHSVIHRDLCLENLLLVHYKPLPSSCSKTKEDQRLPRLIISNFLKAKQKPGAAESKAKKSQARLAPEIVSASQYKKFDEFQTGILIYELLHQPNPFEVKADLREQEYSKDDLPPLPNLSIYSRGLQQLAHLLLEADPIKRIRIIEAKRIVQCLLWGPRKDLTDQPLNHEEAHHGALHNWIDMKRALLMMKFAERAVDADRSVELEDWLCCQYLASADPSSLWKSLKLLQLL